MCHALHSIKRDGSLAWLFALLLLAGILAACGSTKNVRAARDGEEFYSNSPVQIRPHF